MKKLLLTSLICVASATQALFAVQARRDVIHTLVQPDGSTLQVSLVGDEAAHCYVTTDNLPVLRAEDGRWCFAMLDGDGNPVASTVAAADPDKRTELQATVASMISAEKVGEAIFSRAMATPRARSLKPQAVTAADSKGIGLFDEVCFPSDGERHALVILVQYADVKFTTNNAGDYFDRFLNEVGFSSNGATGSVRDFYISGSGGNFTPHFDLYGPVTLRNRRSYYGGNDAGGNDLRPCQMVKEACELLDDEINFADYDIDNDGYVDNVYIIYAGQGEADFGGSDCIWPHRWQLSGDRVYCTLDGKTIENYGCCNEWADNRVAGIGTFCHEFGHVMGLPDLYCTTYTNATKLTPGSWSVMDYGPYLNDGKTPPTFSSFERNALGWIDLRELSGPETVSLDPILDSNDACIITTDKNNEFFLFENRQKTGWDKYLPGHGMLVWHIDFNSRVWNANTVNNDGNHQYVDILEANNLPDNYSEENMAGYSFPGTSRVTSLTADTKPALRTWSGTAIDLPITDIKETSGVITFDVCGGSTDLDAPVAKADDIISTGFTLEWEAVSGALNYVISVMDVLDQLIEGYPVETKATSLDVRFLEPETQYKATVRAVRDESESPESEVVNVTTSEARFEWMFPKPLEATNVSSKGFTANWSPIADAVDYRLTVLTEKSETDETDACGFTTQKPYVTGAGWTTTADGVYESADYSGDDVPSLKLAKHGLNLCSPVYEKAVRQLKFWYRGAGTDPANYLEIEARESEDADWQLVKTICPIKISKPGETLTVSDFPAGMHQVRLVYYKPKNGNVAIDDVVVTLGGSGMAFHADYNAKSVGNVQSHTVQIPASRAENPDNAPVMYYSVYGVNADGKASLASPEVAVVLSDNGDVNSIESAIAPEASSCQIFDLGGRRISGVPAPGIYLRRSGTKTEKIIIK